MCRKIAGQVFVSAVFVLAMSGNVLGEIPCSLAWCEDLSEGGQLISGRRWDQPGTPERVYYYVGEVWSNMPDLAPDVSVAAVQWSDVEFDDETVNFRLINGGRTQRTPGQKDGWNVVDWGIIDPLHLLAEAHVWFSLSNPIQIIEADIVFDYYEPYAVHSDNFPSDKYCIRNVATHEFGHWVFLKDVYYVQCQSYAPYTMFSPGEPQVNIHNQESLECEDKYGLWYTYNEMTFSAPSVRAKPEIVNLPAEAGVAEKTRLLQNYPDPFNPDTWIPYELSEDTDVTIEIYDSTGAMVRKLVLGRQAKGRYIDKRRAAFWDGRNERGELVPSGVYFYTLKADDFSATRRLVLLK